MNMDFILFWAKIHL